MDKIAMKKQILILSAVLALMLLLFYLFAWKPQMAKLDELGKHKIEEERKLQAAKNTLVALQEAKKNAANVEVELIKIANKMPVEPELPSLIVGIQNMANDAGVTLKSIRPGEPTSMGEFSEMKISANLYGSYSAIIDFLRRTEKASRAFKVDSISIRVAEYPDLDLNVAMSVFVMDNNQEIPAAPAQSVSVKK